MIGFFIPPALPLPNLRDQLPVRHHHGYGAEKLLEVVRQVRPGPADATTEGGDRKIGFRFGVRNVDQILGMTAQGCIGECAIDSSENTSCGVPHRFMRTKDAV